MAPPSASDAPATRVVPFRVLIAGVHRTGTSSMRSALFHLGIHDCHHMATLRADPVRQCPPWVRAIEAKYADKKTQQGGEAQRAIDWDELLGDCQAACDIPAAFFTAELAERYPDAKVVVLQRDPDKWYTSVANSIHAPRPPLARLGMLFCLLLDPASRAWMRYGLAMRTHAFGYDHGSERDKALAWYDGIYQEFRDRVPEERRIEYRMGDGWGPLCGFLDLPVPTVRDEATGQEVEAPFPHLNDREAFQLDMAKWQAEAVGRAVDNLYRLIGKGTVLGAAAYVGYVAWKGFGRRL